MKASTKTKPTATKQFRKSLLPLIKIGLNTMGQHPENVLNLIEEELQPREIPLVLDYIKYYCSKDNKETKQDLAYGKWSKSTVKVVKEQPTNNKLDDYTYQQLTKMLKLNTNKSFIGKSKLDIITILGKIKKLKYIDNAVQRTIKSLKKAEPTKRGLLGNVAKIALNGSYDQYIGVKKAKPQFDVLIKNEGNAVVSFLTLRAKQWANENKIPNTLQTFGEKFCGKPVWYEGMTEGQYNASFRLRKMKNVQLAKIMLRMQTENFLVQSEI